MPAFRLRGAVKYTTRPLGATCGSIWRCPVENGARRGSDHAPLVQCDTMICMEDRSFVAFVK
jgi:hypothetical protein